MKQKYVNFVLKMLKFDGQINRRAARKNNGIAMLRYDVKNTGENIIITFKFGKSIVNIYLLNPFLMPSLHFSSEKFSDIKKVCTENFFSNMFLQGFDRMQIYAKKMQIHISNKNQKKEASGFAHLCNHIFHINFKR